MIIKSPISSCSFKIDLGYSAYVAIIKEWKYLDSEHHIMNRGRFEFDGRTVATDKSRYS